MTKPSRFLFVAAVALLTLFHQACGKGPDLDVLPEKAFIVDVRTPEEYQSEHFPGAVNIPLDQVANRLSDFGDKNAEVIVYCKGGVRSNQAKKLLLEKGFKNVKNGGGLRDMLQMLAKAKPASRTN